MASRKFSAQKARSTDELPSLLTEIVTNKHYEYISDTTL